MPDNYGRMTSSEAPDDLKEFCFPKICTCGYDLRVAGHCGTCGQWFSICLDCKLPTKLNVCTCKVKTRHPDYPEEWS